MRLLMIEDNRALADSVGRGLEKEGFAVDLAYTGENGEEMAFVNPYDVILLDLNLPDKDGIDILKALRMDGNETPVIIATARDRVDQRALGLDFGADDYLCDEALCASGAAGKDTGGDPSLSRQDKSGYFGRQLTGESGNPTGGMEWHSTRTGDQGI